MINNGWVSMEIWRALCWLGCAGCLGYIAGRFAGWIRAEADARRVAEIVAKARMEEE